jgi:hypothetical protein
MQYNLFSGVAKDIFTDSGLTDAEAVGLNVFNNNTCVGSGQTTAGYSIDIGSNSNTFKNNIFYQSSQNAVNDMIFRFNTGAFYDSATLDYNAYKKLSEVTFTLVSVTAVDNKTIEEMQADGNEANGQYVDPFLNGTTGKPTGRSPAFIKSGGALIDGMLTNYDGTAPVGAFCWSKGTMMPPGMFYLSSPAGALALGLGKVYVADLTFGGESVTFGGEAATW